MVGKTGPTESENVRTVLLRVEETVRVWVVSSANGEGSAEILRYFDLVGALEWFGMGWVGAWTEAAVGGGGGGTAAVDAGVSARKMGVESSLTREEEANEDARYGEGAEA